MSVCCRDVGSGQLSNITFPVRSVDGFCQADVEGIYGYLREKKFQVSEIEKYFGGALLAQLRHAGCANSLSAIIKYLLDRLRVSRLGRPGGRTSRSSTCSSTPTSRRLSVGSEPEADTSVAHNAFLSCNISDLHVHLHGPGDYNLNGNSFGQLTSSNSSETDSGDEASDSDNSYGTESECQTNY